MIPLKDEYGYHSMFLYKLITHAYVKLVLFYSGPFWSIFGKVDVVQATESSDSRQKAARMTWSRKNRELARERVDWKVAIARGWPIITDIGLVLGAYSMCQVHSLKHS